MVTFSPFSLPSGGIASRAELLKLTMEEIIDTSAAYSTTEYSRSDLLETCITFIDLDLMEAPSSEMIRLSKVGFFPWTEAMRDFDEAVNHALRGSYKSAIDCIRRAFELVVVGGYFTDESVAVEDAHKWIQSNADTPRFNSTLKTLEKTGLGEELAKQYDWPSEIRAFYRSLCNIVHVKGVKSSSHKIQPSNSFIGGKSVPQFNMEAISYVWDAYIQAAQYTALIAAITNPPLLVGLPIDEKFGLNNPISGYFYEAQAARLNALLPEPSKPFFDRVKSKHPSVIEVVNWFHSLPDLTEEEFAAQAADFEAMINHKK